MIFRKKKNHKKYEELFIFVKIELILNLQKLHEKCVFEKDISIVISCF
jgi:hypothetical protein